MGRNWISIPIPHTRIRIGRSMSDAELFGTNSRRREPMPSWIRYELREKMQKAAKERGETLSTEFCNYTIDKAFALGDFGADGRLTIHGSGNNADEVARDIVAKSAAWGISISNKEALAIATKQIKKIRRVDDSNWGFGIAAVVLIVILIILLIANANAGTCRIYSEGTSTVEACEDGSYIITDRDGHRRVYGEPNAGFDRYPGQGDRPVYERRDYK